MMALRRLGVPKNSILSLIDSLQSMQHYLRTGYGDTDRFFTCDDQTLAFHGTGQGNGFSPCIWAAVSTVMLEILKEEGLGSTLISALTHLTTTLIAYAFVDDTDLVRIAMDDETIEDVTIGMQKNLCTWQSILRTTGGALVPKKSWFVAIDFKWNHGRWSYKCNDNNPLYMEDHEQHEESLTQLEPNEAKRMLGV